MFTTREAQLPMMSYGRKRPKNVVCGVALLAPVAVPVVSMDSKIPALSKNFEDGRT